MEYYPRRPPQHLLTETLHGSTTRTWPSDKKEIPGLREDEGMGELKKGKQGWWIAQQAKTHT